MAVNQSKLIPTEINGIFKKSMCANVECKKVEDACNELYVCGGCDSIAYCGVECQKVDISSHVQICQKIRHTNINRIKFSLVENSLKNAVAQKFQESSRISGSFDMTGSYLSSIQEETSSYGSTPSSQSEVPSFWRLNESSILYDSSPYKHCLIRFDDISKAPSDPNFIDVMKIKVWHDVEIPSVGIFMPISMNDRSCEFKFQVYDSKRNIISEREDSFEEMVVINGMPDVGEMILPSPIRLIALRSYFFVLKSNARCCSGEYGQSLHCFHSPLGGVQVSLESPTVEELEDFLTEYENGSSTVKGQFPVIFMEAK